MLLRYWPPSSQLPRIVGANGATQGEAVASAVMSGVLFAIVGNVRSGSGLFVGVHDGSTMRLAVLEPVP